jgi:hypothetical protein
LRSFLSSFSLQFLCPFIFVFNVNESRRTHLLTHKREREGIGEVVTDNNDAELLQAVPKEYKQNNALEVCKSA